MSEQHIALSSFGIDHDANLTLISGIVQSSTHFYLKNTRIITILEPYGDADRHANNMLMASLVKVGSERHRDIPSTVTLVVDGAGNVIRIEEGDNVG